MTNAKDRRRGSSNRGSSFTIVTRRIVTLHHGCRPAGREQERRTNKIVTCGYLHLRTATGASRWWIIYDDTPAVVVWPCGAETLWGRGLPVLAGRQFFYKFRSGRAIVIILVDSADSSCLFLVSPLDTRLCQRYDRRGRFGRYRDRSTIGNYRLITRSQSHALIKWLRWWWELELNVSHRFMRQLTGVFFLYGLVRASFSVASDVEFYRRRCVS